MATLVCTFLMGLLRLDAYKMTWQDNSRSVGVSPVQSLVILARIAGKEDLVRVKRRHKQLEAW